jgi:protein-disulfide isomerase
MKKIKEMKLTWLFAFIILICGIGIYLITSEENSPKDSLSTNLSQVNIKKPAAETQIEQTPEMTQLAAVMFKASKNNSYYVGLKESKVSVVQFIDPENPTGAKIHEYIKNEIKYYGPNVRWTFRYMPFQPNSKVAIKILEASRKQNLYLEVLEILYANIEKWGATSDDPNEIKQKQQELLKIVATVPKIKMGQIQADMKNKSIDKLIEIDQKEGSALGVTMSPTLFVNYKIINPLSLDVMIQRIDEALK